MTDNRLGDTAGGDSADSGVGRVLGTEHTSTREFRVVLDESEYLQLDDLVVVRTAGPASRARSAPTALSPKSPPSTRGRASRATPTALPSRGLCRAQRCGPPRSPSPGSIRSCGSPRPRREGGAGQGDERDKALYVDEMGRPLPIGLGRDGEPVYVDLDFFDGRKGGHMSISGISGVATKTSFALFFLRLLAARPTSSGRVAANLRVLVFNVKGEDLLWLDKNNRYFDEAAAESWQRSALSRGRSLRSRSGRRRTAERRCRHPRHRRPAGGRRRLHLDATGVHRRRAAAVPVHRCHRQPQPDPVHRGAGAGSVAAVSRSMSRAVPGAVVLRDPIEGHGPGSGSTPNPGERIIDGSADPGRRRSRSSSTPKTASPTRSGPAGSRRAPCRRSCAGCIRRRIGSGTWFGRRSRRIDRTAAQVTVVGIQSLHDLGQRFVVGALLAETFAEKETDRAAAAAVGDRSRRTQQVRPPGGQQPAEGHADRHCPTGPVARSAAGWGAADRFAGRLRGHGERRDPGRRAS